MWRLVPCDSWHPVLQRGVRRATAAAVSVAVYRRRQREALSAAYPRDPPRAPAGLGRARACKSAAHRTTTEHAAATFVGLFPFPFVRFSLALVFFTFPRVCMFVLLVVPPRITHDTPCGRATISVGHAHDAGCASRLCTHLGSLRPTISGAASTSSAKCAIWRSDDQLCTVSAVAVLTSGNPRGELISTLRQVGLQL